MRALQITLFLIANVIFLSQAGRNIHQLIFGEKRSVLDEFEPEKQKVRSTTTIRELVENLRSVSDEIKKLEQAEDAPNKMDLQGEHPDLYDKRHDLRVEIDHREERAREVRDLWVFSVYGLLLIGLGAILYRRGVVWPGFAILITGFVILEVWASPAYFGMGAITETYQLLACKTVITFVALALVYILWIRKGTLRLDPKI